MATIQALSVFLQNQSACAECAFWGQHRCPDRWLHANTGVCGACESVWEMRGEHDGECPARDDRIMTQACSVLRNIFRSKTSIEPPESEAASSDDDFDMHSCSTIDVDAPRRAFDEDRIAREHSRICEWCSPFHMNSCNGTRTCREMAGYNHTLACQRMTYVCRNMPASNPRACPLQARIVALAILRGGSIAN